jgi:hypothetical protein
MGDRRIGRRALLAVAGAAAALAGVGAFVLRGRGRSAHDAGADALFEGLEAGTRIDRWTVVAVHEPRMGAIPVVLATADGRSYQVDVLARDDAGPRGVAQTQRFALFVANNGDGALATDEEQGLGALALAAALGERERTLAQSPALLTMNERAARYPDGGFSVKLQ